MAGTPEQRTGGAKDAHFPYFSTVEISNDTRIDAGLREFISIVGETAYMNHYTRPYPFAIEDVIEGSSQILYGKPQEHKDKLHEFISDAIDRGIISTTEDFDQAGEGKVAFNRTQFFAATSLIWARHELLYPPLDQEKKSYPDLIAKASAKAKSAWGENPIGESIFWDEPRGIIDEHDPQAKTDSVTDPDNTIREKFGDISERVYKDDTERIAKKIGGEVETPDRQDNIGERTGIDSKKVVTERNEASGVEDIDTGETVSMRQIVKNRLPRFSDGFLDEMLTYSAEKIATTIKGLPTNGHELAIHYLSEDLIRFLSFVEASMNGEFITYRPHQVDMNVGQVRAILGKLYEATSQNPNIPTFNDVYNGLVTAWYKVFEKIAVENDYEGNN